MSEAMSSEAGTTTERERRFLEEWRDRLGFVLTGPMERERDQVRLKVDYRERGRAFQREGVTAVETVTEPVVTLAHLGHKVAVNYVCATWAAAASSPEVQERVERGVRRLFGVWRAIAGKWEQQGR
jgi:hypothetical protein